jgi:hypothetical protein
VDLVDGVDLVDMAVSALGRASLGAVSFGRPSLCFRGFLLPIPRGRIRLERTQQAHRDFSDAFNRGQECRLVCLRRLRKAADFSDKLQGGGAHLIVRHGRFEIEKGSDIPAHNFWLISNPFLSVLCVSLVKFESSFRDCPENQ